MVVGQTIVLATALTILGISESARFTGLLNALAKQRALRVSDDKGVILLLLTVSYLLLPVLEFLSSQARVSRFKEVHRRIKSARASLFCSATILHAMFISAYIFRSLTTRVYNIFGLAFVFMFLNAAGNLARIRILVTWGYFGFTACTAVISLLVFVARADFYYAAIARLVISVRLP